MSEPAKVLELKTTIQVDKTMKLLDINGKKINFTSDCIVVPKKQKNASFHICVVQQDDLDSGSIPFEVFQENFSRRVTYESPEEEHKNHYIAVKKLSTDTSTEPIECDVIIRLTELPPPPPPQPVMPEEDPRSILEENDELKKQLYQLSQTKEYEQSSNQINDQKQNIYRNIAIGCLIIFVFILIKKMR